MHRDDAIRILAKHDLAELSSDARAELLDTMRHEEWKTDARWSPWTDVSSGLESSRGAVGKLVDRVELGRIVLLVRSAGEEAVDADGAGFGLGRSKREESQPAAERHRRWA